MSRVVSVPFAGDGGGRGKEHVADVADAGVAAERLCSGPHHLHAVVLLRIVGGRDLRAAFEIVVDHREVELVGAEHPVVDDVGALCPHALDERGRERWRRQPHVARHRHGARLQIGREPAPDRFGCLFVQLTRVETADVVGFEDGRIDLHRDTTDQIHNAQRPMPNSQVGLVIGH